MLIVSSRSQAVRLVATLSVRSQGLFVYDINLAHLQIVKKRKAFFAKMQKKLSFFYQKNYRKYESSGSF